MNEAQLKTQTAHLLLTINILPLIVATEIKLMSMTKEELEIYFTNQLSRQYYHMGKQHKLKSAVNKIVKSYINS